MFSLISVLIWKFALPLILVIALADVLTQSQPQRIRRLYRSGLSQRSIASRLGVSRYRVRMALG